MRQKANKIGANAVLGLKVDLEEIEISQLTRISVVVASGTAVTLQRPQIEYNSSYYKFSAPPYLTLER